MCFELPYSALTTYSPRGQSEVSQKSRILRNQVKAGRDDALNRAAEIIRDREEIAALLSEFLNPSTVLVPVPRSSLQVPGGLWPSLKIAQALQNAGLVTHIEPCLKRIKALPKSSFQSPGERPPVDMHVESLAVELQSQDILPIEFTLVDDFITKGTTLYACALKLREAFSNSTIRAFALVRTMGLVPDVRNIVDPCVGTITYNGYETNRSHSQYE